MVPLPTQVPPAPFAQADLQRLYTEITRDYPYSQFQLLPGGAGATIMNTPGDLVLVQPGLVQVQAVIDLTPEGVREKATTILTRVFDRMRLQHFINCGIKIVCHATTPGDDAKAFVSERLMRGAEQADELGPDFFCGGVKFRRIREGCEENLLIEPFVHDNKLIFTDYDIGRTPTVQPFSDVGEVSGWIDEAVDFVRGPMKDLLERE